MWKLNTSLLSDLDFVNSINSCIDETLLSNENFSSKRAKWDYLKFKVKETALRESKKKAKAKRQETDDLENEVTRLKQLFTDDPNNDVVKAQLKESQNMLDD